MTSLSNLGRAIARFTSLRRGSVVVVLAATAAQAQARPVNPTTPDATRAELTRMLDSLQRLQGSGTGKRGKNDHSDEIATLRARLTDGDFQVGDRFLVDDGVKRDTILVRDSVQISLLNWPSYSIRGVLRSELQGAVEKYIGTYVREPRIRTYPLVRLSFTGGFGRPGYLIVDPARPFSDAINAVGGPVQTKHPEQIEVFRANKRIINEKRVAEAVRNGETIDDLHLLSGDEVRVPLQKQSGYRMPPYQLVLISISAFGAILALIRSAYQP